MPFAVFFTGGYAVHATDAVTRLGQPASHGCVRLAPANAAMFFDLVKTYGKANTKIVITQ
jgi:lipoprotein-anchoring transpeptidase ErfK/SrfK